MFLDCVEKWACSVKAVRPEMAYMFGWPLILLGLATTYTIWWLWRFTVVPALRPHEPREIPYWIPGQFIAPIVIQFVNTPS